MDNINVKGSPKYIDSTKKLAEDFLSNLKSQLKTEIAFSFSITLHPSRESFNAKLGRATETWEVGNTYSANLEIDILDPEAFEKDSSHSKDEFSLSLNHEIVHISIISLSNGHAVPLWLNEGLAKYFTEQPNPVKGLYIEEYFSSKISTQHGWNTYSEGEAYAFSGLFVGYLVKQYSLEKILVLVKTLDKAYYQEAFEHKFNEIFGINLIEAERDFVRGVNM